uniref:Uncharacterized protein n=1 Tax=Nyssomyia neivai TaxID=330878 RepID=A0A1L8D725_9DIPT
MHTLYTGRSVEISNSTQHIAHCSFRKLYLLHGIPFLLEMKCILELFTEFSSLCIEYILVCFANWGTSFLYICLGGSL